MSFQEFLSFLKQLEYKHYLILQLMSEEHLGKSAKKSSRLNPKKEEKPQIFIDPTWVPTNIDLYICQEDKMTEHPRIIKGAHLYATSQGEFVSSYLAQFLKNQDICREQSSISFWEDSKKSYIFGFKMTHDCLKITRNVPIKFYNKKANLIKMKIRIKRKLIVDSLIQEQRIKYDDFQTESTNKTKQKKIGQVVEKVALWRKFYTGFYDQFGNYIQKPLQTAAQEVGIAKKTLDDYLLQIRNGKKYGFNFNDKASAKIGQLRAFVRDQKKKDQGK